MVTLSEIVITNLIRAAECKKRSKRACSAPGTHVQTVLEVRTIPPKGGVHVANHLGAHERCPLGSLMQCPLGDECTATP